MSQPPDEPEPTRPFLATPVSPSGEQESAPPPQPVPSPYGVAGYAPYAPAPGMPGYPFAQAHAGANTAMWLGIVSLACALGAFLVCVTLPGALCGPFAIAFAVKAQRDIKAAPGRYHNEGAAIAGLVTGIIGTVIGVAALAVVVFVFGAFFGAIG